MNGIRTIRLELRAPLLYREDRGLVPWEPGKPEASRPPAGPGERLFCFTLDAGQRRSIEPDPARFLGALIAAGGLVTGPGEPAGSLELPAGNYLFAQQREVLDREAFIGMAVELQKDGLWEGLELGERLYLRYLFEDGKAVTQAFRPCRAW
jgi:hypothetical protein